MMRRPYKELSKPFATRLLELLDGLQLIADSLRRIQEGENRYLIILSGQLRSLIAERSKGEVPLLLDVAAKFNKSLDVWCMEGVDNSPFPDELRSGVFLHVAGPPLTPRQQFERQRKLTLPALLEENFVLFNGNKYSLKTVIEWYANKAGGVHYSSKIPEDFAALLTIDVMNIQPLARLLVQIGEATLTAGRQLLKEMVEFEIYCLIALPRQSPSAVKEINYLFDSQYEGSNMRISLTLNSRLMPSFFARGLQGTWGRADCDRILDWSKPKLIHATLLIEDDLTTTLELAVDGLRVGRINVKQPLFVLSDPLDYDTCHNKAVDDQPQELALGISEFAMVGAELSSEDRANMLLYFSRRRATPDLKTLSYSPGSFGEAREGTKEAHISGVARLMLASELLASWTDS